jgi:hypothetical protein
VKITAANRGPAAAELHLLPTLWFRNDWSSWIVAANRAAKKPNLKQMEGAAGTSAGARQGNRRRSYGNICMMAR